MPVSGQRSSWRGCNSRIGPRTLDLGHLVHGAALGVLPHADTPKCAGDGLLEAGVEADLGEEAAAHAHRVEVAQRGRQLLAGLGGGAVVPLDVALAVGVHVGGAVAVAVPVPGARAAAAVEAVGVAVALLAALLSVALVFLELVVDAGLDLGPPAAAALVGLLRVDLALAVVVQVRRTPGQLGGEVGPAHLLGALAQDLLAVQLRHAHDLPLVGLVDVLALERVGHVGCACGRVVLAFRVGFFHGV